MQSASRRALHLCDNKCIRDGCKFYQLVAVVTEEGRGKARTINLCKQCYNGRRLKHGERAVTASKWREMVEQKAFRGKVWAAFGMASIRAQTVRTFHHQNSMGQVSFGRCGKRKDKTEQTAGGNRRRHIKENLNLSDAAATCVLHTDASGIRSGDVRRLDKLSCSILEW